MISLGWKIEGVSETTLRLIVGELRSLHQISSLWSNGFGML
jgi:hypothetical protein